MTALLSGPEYPSASGTTHRLVVFLHGVGSNGEDLISLAPIFSQGLVDTHFLSPNAPEPYDMAPFGYQWFSLYDRTPEVMEQGLRRAAVQLNAYLDAQRARFGLADADIALVGFSQGTMTALFTALRREAPLGAVIGFSGALLAPETLGDEITATPPVCLIHGERDDVVPFEAMARAQEALEGVGVTVETHARPRLGHGIDENGIADAMAFLHGVWGV